MDTRLHFEATSTWEDGITFAVTDGNGDHKWGKHLAISVAEEQAVDSYNSTFTCTFHLNEKQVGKVLEFITAHFPVKS